MIRYGQVINGSTSVLINGTHRGYVLSFRIDLSDGKLIAMVRIVALSFLIRNVQQSGLVEVQREG